MLVLEILKSLKWKVIMTTVDIVEVEEQGRRKTKKEWSFVLQLPYYAILHAH